MKHESIDARVRNMGFDATQLMNRRATIISLLRSLQKSLEQNDQISDGPRSLIETKAFDQEAGIKAMITKPTSSISHRGVQLAAEVHAKFDRGGRGSLGFKEFRGYLAALGRSSEQRDMMDNEESFSLFFDDLGGLDEEGRVTPYGMVKYRELMEEEVRLGVPNTSLVNKQHLSSQLSELTTH